MNTRPTRPVPYTPLVINLFSVILLVAFLVFAVIAVVHAADNKSSYYEWTVSLGFLLGLLCIRATIYTMLAASTKAIDDFYKAKETGN